jgi:hypothetical protein
LDLAVGEVGGDLLSVVSFDVSFGVAVVGFGVSFGVFFVGLGVFPFVEFWLVPGGLPSNSFFQAWNWGLMPYETVPISYSD